MSRPAKLSLLQILAVDGLRSVVGLHRAEPQVIDALDACVRDNLVKVVRPRLRPTGYSRREVPTDVAVLTSHGRMVAQRLFGRSVPVVSLVREVEHRVGVGELRSHLRIAPDAWMSPLELRVARATELRSDDRGLPDGLADVDGMRLAFEYDYGRYTAVQVHRKQLAFRRLADAAVWAAPTTCRAEWLQSLDCAHVLVVSLPLGTAKTLHQPRITDIEAQMRDLRSCSWCGTIAAVSSRCPERVSGTRSYQ